MKIIWKTVGKSYIHHGFTYVNHGTYVEGSVERTDSSWDALCGYARCASIPDGRASVVGIRICRNCVKKLESEAKGQK